VLRQAVRHRAGQAPPRVRQLRHRRALKLVLLENSGQGGSLNHLGVEVPDTETVEAEQARLGEAGLAGAEEEGTVCCCAQQDKFWVQGAPNGESWEIYTVPADSPTFYGEGHGTECCGGPGGHTEQEASTGAVCC
jgi:hypothetical protein